MQYLEFWQGALMLASIPVLHWAVLGRTLAVAGRFSAIVDRVRDRGTAPDPGPAMTEAELLAAIRAETSTVFGAEAVEEAPAPSGSATSVVRPPDSPSMHLSFLGGVALGGLVSTMVAGTFVPTLSLRGELFAKFAGGSPASSVLVPLVGGLLVGAGTRMAGGCTSGHGLCGMSQFQRGSLVATMSFFGVGIVISLAIGALI